MPNTTRLTLHESSRCYLWRGVAATHLRRAEQPGQRQRGRARGADADPGWSDVQHDGHHDEHGADAPHDGRHEPRHGHGWYEARAQGSRAPARHGHHGWPRRGRGQDDQPRAGRHPQGQGPGGADGVASGGLSERGDPVEWIGK